MQVQDVAAALERIAPSALAAEWDNVGLLAGDAQAEARKCLLCIDLTAEVLSEALVAKAQVVLAYHPPIFKALRRVTAGEAPVVFEAVRRGLSVCSVHTALDAVPGGTNDVLAGMLGLRDMRPLEPAGADDECKIVTFVPPRELSRVAEAAFCAGAGRIGNYFDCAFFAHGVGTFCGGEGTHPAIGRAGRHEAVEEMRLEVVAPAWRAAEVCNAIRAAHSYEEPVVDVYPMRRYPPGSGMGRVGTVARPLSAAGLVRRVKRAAGVSRVWVAEPAPARRTKTPPRVKRAACAAGSCGDLWRKALQAGATFYLTGEMRHHDALAAAGAGMTVVCLGHGNSERPALVGLAHRLRAELPGLRVVLSRRDRDPLQIV